MRLLVVLMLALAGCDHVSGRYITRPEHGTGIDDPLDVAPTIEGYWSPGWADSVYPCSPLVNAWSDSLIDCMMQGSFWTSCPRGVSRCDTSCCGVFQMVDYKANFSLHLNSDSTLTSYLQFDDIPDSLGSLTAWVKGRFTQADSFYVGQQQDPTGYWNDVYSIQPGIDLTVLVALSRAHPNFALPTSFKLKRLEAHHGR